MAAPADRPLLGVPAVPRAMDPLPVMALLFGLIGLTGNLFAALAAMAGICAIWPLQDRPGLARGYVLAVAGLVLGGVGMLVLIGTSLP